MVEIPIELKKPLMYTDDESRYVNCALAAIQEFNIKVLTTICLGKREGHLYIRINTDELEQGDGWKLMENAYQISSLISERLDTKVIIIYRSKPDDQIWVICKL